VTDAALVLGMLGEGELAAGIRLDPELARAALAPLGEQLALPIEDVARGILTIANASMADTIREITAEQGLDPRHATLMAFGGAGPVFATLLARELGIGSIVVPPYAGNFSAWGLLGSDLTQEAARTQILPLTDPGLENARTTVAGLFAQLEGRPGSEPEVRFDVRYVGQEHTLTIVAPADAAGVLDDDAAALREQFSVEYRRAFGAILDEELEIVTYRVIATTPLRHDADARMAAGDAPGGAAGEQAVEAWSFTRGEQATFPVRARASLAPGDTLAGPAILTEPTTTTYLDAGHTATVHPTGALVITVNPGSEA
jgi:N-methylhydantoinase A